MRDVILTTIQAPDGGAHHCQRARAGSQQISGTNGAERGFHRTQPGERMTDDPRKRGMPDRSKISMTEAHEVRYWTRHLGVSKEELQRAVDKVGNSAATVRKQLGK
jgi:uncharacterized protein DUF3606